MSADEGCGAEPGDDEEQSDGHRMLLALGFGCGGGGCGRFRPYQGERDLRCQAHSHDYAAIASGWLAASASSLLRILFFFE